MAYIETKVECITCKGEGNFYPLGTFNKSEKKPSECINCHGKGHIVHNVLVNPVKDEKIEESEITDVPKKTNKKKEQ